MKKAYVTLLASENYLLGTLVLWYSLHKVKSTSTLVVMVTYNLEMYIKEIFQHLNIEYINVESIENPHMTDIHSPLFHMFDKLNAFNLTEYDKIVYLDSDMLVCKNIDELFEKPMLSAVNTGGRLPWLKNWTQFNAGLIVIEPSVVLFNDFIDKLKYLKSDDSGDQGFLHSYYPDWPDQYHLHLDHSYNMSVNYVDDYNKLFGYTLSKKVGGVIKKTDIKVIHYWADYKPWNTKYIANSNLEKEAVLIWQNCYKKVRNLLM